jgi:hypothetical protein
VYFVLAFSPGNGLLADSAHADRSARRGKPRSFAGDLSAAEAGKSHFRISGTFGHGLGARYGGRSIEGQMLRMQPTIIEDGPMTSRRQFEACHMLLSGFLDGRHEHTQNLV